MQFPKSEKRVSNPKYLKLIRMLPCCTCGRFGQSTAHHLLRNVGHAMGRKASDYQTVPMCMICHDRLHRNGNELKFFAEHQIYNPRGLAEELHKNIGDRDMCEDLIMRRFR